MKIVVCEDDFLILMNTAEMLRELGHDAEETADGRSALEALARGGVDILLTDVGLPGGLNGRQLADAARTFRPDLKVLFMTGYVHDVDSGGVALEPGMEIITKPFTSDRLAAQVEAFIGI